MMATICSTENRLRLEINQVWLFKQLQDENGEGAPSQFMVARGCHVVSFVGWTNLTER